MANTTLTYRLEQEIETTLILGNAILTELAIAGGNSMLYQLRDKEQKSRTLLYLFLYALGIYDQWNGENDLLSTAEVTRLLTRAQQIYKATDCVISQTTETDSINSGNVFGGNNPTDSGTSEPVTITLGAVKGIDIKIKVGTPGALLAVGATSFTIPYAYVIPGTVKVEYPEVNAPQDESNQFSWHVTYGTNSTLVTFTNMDGETNLGVLEGVLMITGLRYSAGASGDGPAVVVPKSVFINGTAFTSGVYTNTDYTGYDWMVFYNGINRYLEPGVEFEVNEIGSAITILLGTTLTADDKFMVSPNGEL